MIKFKYGSGLGHTLSTRSPLFRNFYSPFKGDENNDVNVSEFVD